LITVSETLKIKEYMEKQRKDLYKTFIFRQKYRFAILRKILNETV